MSTKSLASLNAKTQPPRSRPVAPVPDAWAPPHDARLVLGRIAIVVVLVAWFAFVAAVAFGLVADPEAAAGAGSGGHGTGGGVAGFGPGPVLAFAGATLVAATLVGVLAARQGALHRLRAHTPVSRAELGRHFAARQGSVTVLITAGQQRLRGATARKSAKSAAAAPGAPASSERAAGRVAERPSDRGADTADGTPDSAEAAGRSSTRATVWSAALQEYPALRVVLLGDDPQHPGSVGADAAYRRREARAITTEISDALAGPSARFQDSLLICELELADSTVAPAEVVRALAGDYAWAAAWLRELIAAENVARAAATDACGSSRGSASAALHTFFVEHTLGDLAAEFTAIAAELDGSAHARTPVASEHVLQLQRRLAWTFTAELESFDPGLYPADATDAAARDLDAYLALRGRTFAPVPWLDGFVQPLEVPDSDYLLTLAPGSQLRGDYCLRLVHFLEQPANGGVAVAQAAAASPRRAFARHNRLGGFAAAVASTVRFVASVPAALSDAVARPYTLLHRGASPYGASFWVGANALIRTTALDDLAVDGATAPIPRDSVSTVSLGTHRWTLANVPERLSFSLASPGLGAVMVQQRPVATGRPTILPRVWRRLRLELGARSN